VKDSEIIKYVDWLDVQKGLARNIATKTPGTTTDRKYIIIGKIVDSRIIQTKKGQQIAFLKLEDSKGSIDLVIFPKIWEEKSKYITIDSVMAFSGKIDFSRKDPKFLVANVLQPDVMNQFQNSEVHSLIEK